MVGLSKKIISTMLCISMITLLGGCSLFDADRNEIKSKLREKYGIDFVVTSTWQGGGENVRSFMAYPKNDENRKFEGRISYDNLLGIQTTSEYTKTVKDNYVATFVAEKLTAEMTELLDDKIPGIHFLVRPSSPALYDGNISTNTNVSIEEWILDNKNAADKNGYTYASGLRATVLFPVNRLSTANYKIYREVIEDLFEKKYSAMNYLSIEESFWYSSDEMKNEQLDSYKSGTYDIDLLRATRSKYSSDKDRELEYNGAMRALKFKYSGHSTSPFPGLTFDE